MGLDVEALLSKIYERLQPLSKEVDCAIACISGGVDSTTSAVIARKFLEDKVYGVFINTGFMRAGEGERVREALRGLIDVEVYDFSEEFISRVEGFEDAEEKRKLFRDLFYTAVKRIASEKGCSWVVQGTIKADVVETLGGVKTQHNVLTEELLKRYGLRVIEPLIDLYKHEVRALAKHLGLPSWLASRQPFPGPGLLVRVVGRVYREKLELVRRLTTLVEEKLSGKGISQYFPAAWEHNVVSTGEERGAVYEVHGVRVTGVVGGRRSYGHPVVVRRMPRDADIYSLYKEFDTVTHPHILIEIESRDRGKYVVAIRAVLTQDFMTADVAKLSIDELKSLAREIMSLEPEVKMVAYDITPKPPATIEYE
jgi:GMP synthase (glutamine-hydrolysing)